MTTRRDTAVSAWKHYVGFFLNILLTVHLNIFIININQLDALNFIISISSLYMFRGLCAHRQEGKIVLYSLWYHHTYRCDDIRDCIIQFCPPDDEHMCSKHVKAWNKLIIKFSASSCLILINKLCWCYVFQKVIMIRSRYLRWRHSSAPTGTILAIKKVSCPVHATIACRGSGSRTPLILSLGRR